MSFLKTFAAAGFAAWLGLILSPPSLADDRSDAIGVVQDAEATLQHFLQDPEMQWFRDNLGQAKALVIIPQLFKAGFIFGASGGSGIVMAKDKATNAWRGPAFYSIGSVTWGLQIGGEMAEVVMLVMTEAGMHSLLSTKLQLGGDISLAAGPVGAGMQAATVDVLQFTRNKGIYGGLTLEGAVITPRDDLSYYFYGKPLDSLDVLVRTLPPRTRYTDSIKRLLANATNPG
jgi:lipid-binding SYLF domain-containing protein